MALKAEETISPIGRKKKLVPSSDRGFTLIELLLVVVILSVIVAISLPGFRATFSDLRTRGFIQDLVSLGAYARERAILEGKPFRINLDFSNHTYGLSFKNNPQDQEFIRLNERIFQRHAIPQDLTTQTNIDHIDFYPDGRTDKVSINITTDNKDYTLNSDESLGCLNVQESQD
jgi:prepilin-type N-terminal cleavage/methylation domain-containing protein